MGKELQGEEIVKTRNKYINKSTNRVPLTIAVIKCAVTPQMHI